MIATQTVDKKLNFSLIYTIALLFLPILSIYSSRIKVLTLGEAIFLFLCICIYAVGNEFDVNIKYTFIFIFYVVFVILVNVSLSIFLAHTKIDLYYSFLLLFKHLLYIIILITLNLKYFDLFLSIIIIKRITILVSLLLILQVVFYYRLGVHLNLFLPFLSLHVEGFNVFSFMASNLYRPAAIFYEPAHFVQYVLFGLCFCLFPIDRIVEKKDILFAVIITVSIFLSTSGMGMAISMFLWVIFIAINFKKIGVIRAILIVFILCFLLFYLYKEFSFINAAIARVFSPKFETGAIWGRIYAIDEYMYHKHSLINILFGYGYGYRPVPYLSSFFFFLFGLGLLSVAFIIYIYIYYIRISVYNGVKIALLVSMLLFFISYGFPSYPLLFYFSFVINKKNLNLI